MRPAGCIAIWAGRGGPYPCETGAAAPKSVGSTAVHASHLYFRTGLGLDHAADTAFENLDCSSVLSVAFYGCGRGDDDAPYCLTGGFGKTAASELRLGQVTNGRKPRGRDRIRRCRCAGEWLAADGGCQD